MNNKKSLVKVLDRSRVGFRGELLTYLESLIVRTFTGNIVLECQGDKIKVYETPRGRNRINSIHRWPQATAKDGAVDSHVSQITVQNMVDELKKRWLGSGEASNEEDRSA